MPRFVVLEHRWAGRHFDFMLEDAATGTLRTWAIDVPIVAGLDLSARPLADHRAAYLEYEGPISMDRGEVRRLDRGDYEPVVWTPTRVEVVLSGSWLRGRVSLEAPAPEPGEPEPVPGRSWNFRFGNFI